MSCELGQLFWLCDVVAAKGCADPFRLLLIDRWKKQRKAAHAGVNIRVSENYYPIMEREAALVIQEFNASPDEWDAHLRR